MKRFVLALIITLSLPKFAIADEIKLSYRTFYTHIKKLDNEDTQALQFAFGFLHVNTGRLCTINSARISTEKQQLPLTISSEQRFTIQSERALSLANAFVVIDFKEASNQCDISVQLETKPEYLKTDYTFAELEFLYQQYEAFFNEMGSFLSFMMPRVNGLMFQFRNKNLNEPTKTGERVSEGNLKLDDEWFARQRGLSLQTKPLRITAVATN